MSRTEVQKAVFRDAEGRVSACNRSQQQVNRSEAGVALLLGAGRKTLLSTLVVVGTEGCFHARSSLSTRLLGRIGTQSPIL